MSRGEPDLCARLAVDARPPRGPRTSARGLGASRLEAFRSMLLFVSLSGPRRTAMWGLGTRCRPRRGTRTSSAALCRPCAR